MSSSKSTLKWKDYFCIIFSSFLALGMCQDRIIVSNLNSDEDLGNSTEENSIIPESLLIQLGTVQNVSDLFNRFLSVSLEQPTILHGSPVASAENATERSKLLRGSSATNKILEKLIFRVTWHEKSSNKPKGRALSAATTATIAQPANCQTEQHIVKLDKPENGAIIFWPSCVRVRRCGGCCTSAMLSCKPLSTSILNVTVLQMFYNHESPNSFESQGTRTFSLEQHDRCACACKEVAADCDPDVHEYKEHECRCVCRNAEEAALCTGPKKIWDNRYCVCKCRKTRMCSTGRYFNVLTCRCEILTRSLSAQPLDQHNSTLSLSSQISTPSP